MNPIKSYTHSLKLGGLSACLLFTATAASAKTAKNVILLVSDGASFNTMAATSYYQHGRLGMQPYEQNGWVRFACSTYPLNRSNTPSGGNTQDAALVYDPIKAWSTATEGSSFASYNWLKATYTDSAAAATALSTGKKSYNNAMNWSNDPKTTGTAFANQSIAEYMKALGKSVGVITSVQWSHATPAGMFAHNVSRNNYEAISNEMLSSTALDVIMGAGHPEFNDSGTAASSSSQYVGGTTTWTSLKTNTHARGWKLAQTKSEFEALTAGDPRPPVLGVAQAATTLQQNRAPNNPGREDAFVVPFNANVPTLETMTKGALNVLDANPKGLFLMIEGGAVDWANHANQAGRMIEEQIDFNNTVQAVINWVNAKSNWDETLVIITSDHDCGLIFGPNSRTIPFEAVVNNGQGVMPGMAFNSDNHSNSLVPVFARGAGQELLVKYASRLDPVYGQYLDNTDIAKTMFASAGVSGKSGESRILAVSARENVGHGENVGIVGFAIDGTGETAVTIAARGPSLRQFGLSNALNDPQLTIYDSTGTPVATNNDWEQDASKTEVQTRLGASINAKDAVLFRNLKPGVYTAIISSADGQTGVGLLEVYTW